MATFVIVHGAWAGAWAWVRVTDRLRARGHRVHVPTLSGLGERSHLAGLPIGLGTHVDDVVNEIAWHGLNEVVLVAHSYGGIVATGVVEKVKERIGSIVYVDAFIPQDGQGFVDFMPGWELEGPLVEPPPTSPGDYADEADRQWVDAKATAQPLATLTDRLALSGAYLEVPKKTYVLASGWNGFQSFAEPLRGQPGWTVREIACGHDIAIERPEELSDVLEAAA